MNTFNPYLESVRILNDTVSVFKNHEIQVMLEDVSSPIRMKYNQKIYDAVISKSHIDFDRIPDSKGDITKYVGYKNMKEILTIIESSVDFKNTEFPNYAKSIDEAVSNIIALKDIYQNGFQEKSEYVMLEYNTYVYTCIEATTSILYQFVDYIKKPQATGFSFLPKNTKYRADLFYIQQLEKFNNLNKNMYGDYRKFLLNMIHGGRDNFVGSATMVGMVTASLVALAIVPITRELVNQFYNIRHSLSESLAYQAYFLELNKVNIENNERFDAARKAKIIAKQTSIKNTLLKLSDKLRISNIKTGEKRRQAIETENRSLSIEKIKKEVNDSPLELL